MSILILRNEIILEGLGIRGIRSKISQETWGTTLVPPDMSLGRLTININAHEFSTARHGSPLDQTTEGIHRLVSITRNKLQLDLYTTYVTTDMYVALAEWLTRCPAKALSFGRAGSNPAGDVVF
ncbi:hypothetical protein PHYBLDRAFT_144182 [Phycomyces blakesleeanus NRRL 1555(-)]|uniref:Uncharacterized protein n=1 Tax=Phycomyces blakesleeanus (strain ATCC 8743b / DSM 1359 / FGSC 10004 / NBRC 33097 / NRRL 1555) TaxID=763407 RepID=A0A162UFR6_PHYB8|nr:hypothetical protein PHYBLDRAFT_144182 [Phycomyces blakesleeanus NRRL 1555(-)]OAD74823.1 hypothetical protein PHYBLDRAFT_144182 [Phycomyces blakesleeanus NRRL 1555(-)]|eukprot:XP_018292863.1 hypothetical protein PHYBLDRAFT_144182 [Phycomyces blakesleeanus NRRL 1555(-)]